MMTGDEKLTEYVVTFAAGVPELDWTKPACAASAETEISTKGRHDPCVGIRAVPIGEAMVACVIADHYLRQRGQMGETPAWPFVRV